jgi:hypothetical protein
MIMQISIFIKSPECKKAWLVTENHNIWKTDAKNDQIAQCLNDSPQAKIIRHSGKSQNAHMYSRKTPQPFAVIRNSRNGDSGKFIFLSSFSNNPNEYNTLETNNRRMLYATWKHTKL